MVSLDRLIGLPETFLIFAPFVPDPTLIAPQLTSSYARRWSRKILSQAEAM